MSLTLFNKRRFSAHFKPVFAALTALLMLSACESTEENEELRIAELEPINIKRHVEVEWRSHYADGVENYYSNLRPVVVGNTIFTASREGEVVAMSADEGDLIWKTDARLDPPTLWDDITFTTKPSAKLNGGVTAAYNNLYVGSENGEVIALSQDEGKILWRAKVKGEVVSAPAAGRWDAPHACGPDREARTGVLPHHSAARHRREEGHLARALQGGVEVGQFLVHRHPQRGEVGPGVRLGIALAPDVLPGQDGVFHLRNHRVVEPDDTRK